MKTLEDLIKIAYFKILNLLTYKQLTMFYGVDIETTTICNRKCSFCPNKFGKRPREKMKEKCFYKIIKDLGTINYNRRISLHLYGEPLLDQRICKFIKYTRKKCPESFIFINSNGDYLTCKLFERLMKAGMDLLYITQYDDKMNKNIRTVLSWLNKKKRWWRKNIYVRVKNNFTDNRGGLLPEMVNIKKPLRANCPRPRTKLAINWQGKVLLCCDDYFGKVIMGDANKQSLMEIWNGRRFKLFRKYLRKKRRDRISICKSCSFKGGNLFYELSPWENLHIFGLAFKHYLNRLEHQKTVF